MTFNRPPLMSNTLPKLHSLHSPFPKPNSTLRVLETEGSLSSIWSRIFNGSYGRPFIIESGHRRFLHFDLDSPQSVMYLRDPGRLALHYTRKMMAFLLFNDSPRRVLLLGLGGGSLAKFCHRRLHSAAVTTVEVNSDVIALRGEFRIPADDDRFRIIHADAATYLAQLTYPKDVILADACDRTGTARELDALEFYHNAWRCLSEEGVFVANICGETRSCDSHMRKIRAVFGEALLTLKVRQHQNIIVFAFKGPLPTLDWERLERTGAGLKKRFGLNFPRYVRRLESDWTLHRRQRALNALFARKIDTPS